MTHGSGDIRIFRTGDSVRYRGQIYWIVRGPIITNEGSTFRISKIPPEYTVNERDLQPVEDPGSMLGTRRN